LPCHQASWSACSRRSLGSCRTIDSGIRAAMNGSLRSEFCTAGASGRVRPMRSLSKSSAELPGTAPSTIRSLSTFMAKRPWKQLAANSLGSSGRWTSVRGRIPKS
jgi:hypothetical protein